MALIIETEPSSAESSQQASEQVAQTDKGVCWDFTNTEFKTLDAFLTRKEMNVLDPLWWCVGLKVRREGSRTFVYSDDKSENYNGILYVISCRSGSVQFLS